MGPRVPYCLLSFSKQHFFTPFLPHLYKEVFSLLISPSPPLLPYGSQAPSFPGPGQPDAIGASSLRDPVPYLSLMCLLFLAPPSIMPQSLRVPTG